MREMLASGLRKFGLKLGHRLKRQLWEGRRVPGEVKKGKGVSD